MDNDFVFLKVCCVVPFRAWVAFFGVLELHLPYSAVQKRRVRKMWKRIKRMNLRIRKNRKRKMREIKKRKKKRKRRCRRKEAFQ